MVLPSISAELNVCVVVAGMSEPSQLPPPPGSPGLTKQESLEYPHSTMSQDDDASSLPSGGIDNNSQPGRSSPLKKKRMSARTSKILKMKSPPVPSEPILDLSTLYCGGEEDISDLVTGGSTLTFECKAKGSKFGSLSTKLVQLVLDLNEITLKVSKETAKGSGEYTEGNIFRVDEVGQTRLVKPNELEVHFVGVGTSGRLINKESKKWDDASKGGEVANAKEGEGSNSVGEEVTKVGAATKEIDLLEKEQMHHPTKRYLFGSPDEAYKFHTCFEVMKESGAVLKTVFRALDRKGSGHIGKNELLKAMKKNGMECLDPSEGDAELAKMIALADSNTSSGIDFIEFFRLFMFTPCSSVHQALTEWRNKVALDQGKGARGDIGADGSVVCGSGSGGDGTKNSWG